MKNIILTAIALFILSGCASTKIIKADIHIDAPADIMQECPEFVLPNDGTFSEALRIIIENKKVYEICNLQNNAKKDFIENYNK